MTNALYAWHADACARLKWHRARRRPGDVPFTRRRLVEGLRLGASIEIDLRRCAGGGFAVLHDRTLDRETTGRGPVASADTAALKALRLRDAAGGASAHGVLTLEELAHDIVGASAVHPDARLQLDCKNARVELHDADIEAFARVADALRGVASLSCGDAATLVALGAVAPGFAFGYDPCRPEAMRRLRQAPDFARFAADALAAAPGADMIYLHHDVIVSAHAAGVDLVGVFAEAGLPVDAWTIASDSAPERDRVRRLLELGVHQITTDDPEALAAAFPRRA